MLSGAAAKAQLSIQTHEVRIEKLETAPERLARIEALQEAQGLQLNRIERKLDNQP